MVDKKLATTILVTVNARDWTVHRERTEKVQKDTWHHRPEPLPDESLSSFFTRAAKANVAEPLKIIRALHPRKVMARFDMDRSLNSGFFQKFAQGLVMDTDMLSTTCKIGTYKKELMLDGARYCPFCLVEDGQVPYFRYAWRLNFITVCTIHGCYLEDKCPHCGAPVHYWETRFDQAITLCFKCGESILAPRYQARCVEPEYNSHHQFYTYQEALLAIFCTETWNEKIINRVKFFNQFWKLAWALHWLNSSRKRELIEPKDGWKIFKNEMATSSVDAFKVLYPAFKVLEECPERLDGPFKCPEDGRSFSSASHYVRHISVHEIFHQMKILQPDSKINYIKFQKSLPKQLLSLIKRLNIPQMYQSSVLADAANFLTGAPADFLLHISSSKHPHLLSIGLALTFGRFYGIFPREIAFLLGTSPQAVINARVAFQTIAHSFQMKLPDTPLPAWTNRIFTEVHERFRTLSPYELAELVKAVWTLKFPWRQGYFLEHIATFAEAIYAYWAESLGHQIPLKHDKPFKNPTLTHLLQQLASSVERVNLDQTQNLFRIIGEKGQLLTPFAEFHKFLQTRFPLWRTYPYSTLVAVLFKFVSKKHQSSNLPRFSRSYGVNPSAMLSNINKINKAVKMNQYKKMLPNRRHPIQRSSFLE